MSARIFVAIILAGYTAPLLAAPKAVKLPAVNSTFEWTINQDFVMPGEASAGTTAEIEKRLKDPTTDVVGRQNLLVTKANAEELASSSMKETIKVTLSLVDEQKFKAVQTFIDPETNTASRTIEYYAPGNGLVYTVDRSRKIITINNRLPLLLSGLARGIPAVAAGMFPLPPAQAISEIENGQAVVKLEGGGEGFRIVKDQATQAIRSINLWSGRMLRQLVSSPELFNGTPYPASLEYVSWTQGGTYLKQVWKLDKVGPIPPDTSFDYSLEKGFTVDDQIGKKRYPVDLLLKNP